MFPSPLATGNDSASHNTGQPNISNDKSLGIYLLSVWNQKSCYNPSDSSYSVRIFHNKKCSTVLTVHAKIAGLDGAFCGSNVSARAVGDSDESIPKKRNAACFFSCFSLMHRSSPGPRLGLLDRVASNDVTPSIRRVRHGSVGQRRLGLSIRIYLSLNKWIRHGHVCKCPLRAVKGAS